MTAPHFLHEKGYWTVGKALDTFTPLGPVIETELNLEKVKIEAYQNSVKKLESGTDVMVISVAKMISYLSKDITLLPGDVILTGSPLGTDFLKDGDTIECSIQEIGSLRNFVVKSEDNKECVQVGYTNNISIPLL